MTWHTETVRAEGLASLLARIRGAGGIVTGSQPGTHGVRVTWTTTSPPADTDPR